MIESIKKENILICGQFNPLSDEKLPNTAFDSPEDKKVFLAHVFGSFITSGFFDELEPDDQLKFTYKMSAIINEEVYYTIE